MGRPVNVMVDKTIILNLTLPSTAATLHVSHPSRTVSAVATWSGVSNIVGISRGSDSLDEIDDAIDADDILKCMERSRVE